MSEHSIFAPSGGAQLEHCEGSVLMQAQFPEDGDSLASTEGTAAHWYGAEHLLPGGGKPVVGATAPNGVIVTSTMAEGAHQWVEYVEDALAVAEPGAVLNVERRVSIPTVHELCFGTPDTDLWSPATLVLEIIDFKYGFGIHEANGHIQCLEYAEGRLLEILAADPTLSRERIKVIVTIIQPRAFHPLGTVRSWKTTADQVSQVIARLAEQARKSLEPSPVCRTGSGCNHCSARHACTALQQQAYQAAQFVYEATAQTLHGDALGLELQTLEDAMQATKARLSGLQEQAGSEIRRGGRVPGYGIEHGRGVANWIYPADQVAAVGDAFGVDVRKPLQLKTPKQCAGLLDESVIKAYSRHTPGVASLRRTNENLAKQVFQQ